MGNVITSIVRISEQEMRQMFNDGRYVDQVVCGTLREVVLAEHAAPDHQPFGTLSQMISYRDSDDNEIARVHRYLRPDGTLGASGMPDPKRLFKDGILYRLKRKE